MRSVLAILAPLAVLILSVSPIRWLWPHIASWYGLPILALWFYGTIHFATRAALWAIRD